MIVVAIVIIEVKVVLKFITELHRLTDFVVDKHLFEATGKRAG